MDIKLGVEVYKCIVGLKEDMNNLLSSSQLRANCGFHFCSCHYISVSFTSYFKVCLLCLLPFSVQIPTFLQARDKLNSFKPGTTFKVSKI